MNNLVEILAFFEFVPFFQQLYSFDQMELIVAKQHREANHYVELKEWKYAAKT